MCHVAHYVRSVEASKALAALDGGGHGLAAQRARHRLLDVLDHDAVLGELAAIGHDIAEIAAGHALGMGRGRAAMDRRLDLRATASSSA